MNTVFLGNGLHAYTKIIIKSCKKYFLQKLVFQNTVFFIQKPIVRLICQIKGLYLKICYRPHFLSKIHIVNAVKILYVLSTLEVAMSWTNMQKLFRKYQTTSVPQMDIFIENSISILC